MHGLYAREFNTRHRRSGHLFQGRYGAVRIKTDEQLWTVAVYVAMNPVKAGFCARPDEWPWSSHAAALAGSAPDWIDVSRLMSYFGRAGGNPRRRYAAVMGSDPLRVVEGWALGCDDREGGIGADVDALESSDPQTAQRDEVDGWTGFPKHPKGQLAVAAARIEAERENGRVRD